MFNTSSVNPIQIPDADIVITVQADALAPSSARSSADTLVTARLDV